jgi:hypothetical protein
MLLTLLKTSISEAVSARPAEQTLSDPDLAALIEAWPSLADGIKLAIRQLLKANSGG